MLAKEKAAKRAAINATVRKENKAHREATQQRKKVIATTAVHTKRNATQRTEEVPQAPHRVLTRADAVEAGSGAGSHAELIRNLGDNINTRLQDITFEDDLNGDVFNERRAQLMEEARLAAGVKQRVISTSVRDYLGHATELRDLQTVRIAHNSNSITCVAALGTDRIAYGDKSGKVYLVDISLTMSGTGMVMSERAEAQRRRKVLLEPVQAAGIVSIAVSDTTANRPTTRNVFEKTTVDMSCPSYVAAGAMDGSISVWETLTKTHKGLLFMHRKPITGLRFRMDTATLYSSCEDGALRVWSVPQMMAVDKLFGHEGPIHFIDGLRKETAATVGEDGTMRFWKVDAATQQAYTYAPAKTSDTSLNSNNKYSNADATAPPSLAPNVVMETVAMLNEGIVVCGARDGSVVLFDLNRRKPLIVVPAAHGYGFIGDGTGLEKAAAQLAEEDESARTARGFPPGATSLSASGGGSRRNPNPITAVAAVPYADVIATASYDGFVRVWRVFGVGAGAVAPGRRTEDADGQGTSSFAKRMESQLQLVAALPIPAIVNALRFSDNGDVLYVAMAKEPRRGRWVVQSAARNGVMVVPLTEGGKTKLQGMSGEVEHVPAQLFGLCDSAAEEKSGHSRSEGEDEGEEVNHSADAGSSASLSLYEVDDGAAVDDIRHTQEKCEGEEDAEDMFDVDPDGMLHFKKDLPMLKKKKGKKSGMPKVLRQTSAADSTTAATSPKKAKVKKMKSASVKVTADTSKGLAAITAKKKKGKMAY